MNTSKIIKAYIGAGTYSTTEPITQGDYGYILQIEGTVLPAIYRVDFSNDRHEGEALPVYGNENGVEVPEELIATGEDVFAFYYYIGENFGKTAYTWKIPNDTRAQNGDRTPTPTQQSSIDQLIVRSNEAVTSAEQSASAAGQSAQNALQDAGRAERAKTGAETAQGKAEDAQESAERAKGDAETSERNASESERKAKGYAETASAKADAITGLTAQATTLPDRSSATANYNPETGVMSFGIPKGKDGTNGTDGYSPTAYVSKTGKVATITITDENGTTSTQVRDGEDGATGATPNLTIGTVETLDPTDDATATITGTPENPVLNLGIPQGEQGEVTQAEFDELSGEVTDLESGLSSVRGVLSLDDDGTIDYTKENNGKYIRFSTGELTLSTPYCTTNYVNISGLGQITYSRIKSTANTTTVGMAFYDANKMYISGIRATYRQQEAGYEESTADVPTNAVYARFTLFIDETTRGVFAVSGKSILKSALDELTEIVAPLVGVDGRVGTIEDIISLADEFDIPFSILDVGKSIRYSTGETMSNSYNSVTDYINISAYGSLTYRRIKQVDSGTAGMAFYDANKVYISGERAVTQASEAGYMDELAEITVPPNAVYARFTTKKDTQTYGEFSLTGSSKLHDLLPKESVYRKDVTFSSMSPEWYKAQGDSYAGFTINTTYADMITAWDTLMADSKGYITKETIGVGSDNQTMYCYKLIPLRYRNNTGSALVNNPPTFLIVASQHGFEKSAAYGTYYFARDLVYNFDKNPVLNSIRTKCAVYVIPVANPYGFDNKLRKNANGVDLNRNWAVTSDYIDDPTSPYYPGAEPFNQPETQAIKSIIDDEPNLFFMIDYHTNGQYKADSWANVNWISYPHLATINDEYYNRLYTAGQFHISDLSENLPIEYDLNTNGASIGSTTQGAAGAPRPTIGYYCRTQNIMGFTFEGNNGLPSEESAYSAMEQKINSELIGNWIKNIYLAFQNA